MQKREPVISDTVHYVMGEQHFAAIITGLFPDGTQGLVIFPPMGQPYSMSARFDQESKFPGTWHFVEPTKVWGVQSDPHYEWGYYVETSD